MQALDPIPIAVKGKNWTDENSPLCLRLTQNVRRQRAKLGLTMAYVGVSNDPIIQDEYQFLYDAMKDLWVNMMEGKQGFGDKVTKKVQDDMKALMDEIGVDNKWLAAQKA